MSIGESRIWNGPKLGGCKGCTTNSIIVAALTEIDLETWGIASLDTKSLTASEEADFCRISQSIQKAQC